MLNQPQPNRRERAQAKRDLKSARADLDSWAACHLAHDVLGALFAERCDAGLEDPDNIEGYMIAADGSGPPPRFRLRIMNRFGIGTAEKIRDAELLRLAVKEGLAAPETAAEFKRRSAECRRLWQQIQGA